MTRHSFTLDGRARAEGALFGLFIGDALAMPAHWYYNRAALRKDYGIISDYLQPRNPHPDSILWRSHHTVADQRYDILHEQARFWGKPGIHYHQFLKAGENTLNLTLCRLLLHSLLENNGYDPDDYLKRYIAFMTTPGSHRDTYVEEYHRHFFARLAEGRSPRNCGIQEKHIGGLVGLVPIIVYYRNEPQTAATAARNHLSLTHRGPRMQRSADFLIDTLLRVFQGESLQEVLMSGMKTQSNPLFGHPFTKWLEQPDDVVVGRRLSTACYVEDAVPAVIYLAYKYAENPERGLVVNTNLGGDNAHRGALLGALLGGANGQASFPDRWVDGLADSEALGQHIKAVSTSTGRGSFRDHVN
jgi:ADP-ribosyl-[dinitrogen reductase] hydrolase